MCLAIPMRITSVEGQDASIELGGLRQRTSLMLVPEAKVGDYVLVHAGCAIAVLDEQEAEERLALFRELAEFQEQSSAGEADEAAPHEGAQAQQPGEDQ